MVRRQKCTGLRPRMSLVLSKLGKHSVARSLVNTAYSSLKSEFKKAELKRFVLEHSDSVCSKFCPYEFWCSRRSIRCFVLLDMRRTVFNSSSHCELLISSCSTLSFKCVLEFLQICALSSFESSNKPRSISFSANLNSLLTIDWSSGVKPFFY